MTSPENANDPLRYDFGNLKILQCQSSMRSLKRHFQISILKVSLKEPTNKSDMKEEIIMEQVMKHYGNAILAVIVLLALGTIIVAALSSDGYVAMEFKNTLTGFFVNMNALRP